MSDNRRDYGPTGCAKPIRNASLLAVLTVFLFRQSRRARRDEAFVGLARELCQGIAPTIRAQR